MINNLHYRGLTLNSQAHLMLKVLNKVIYDRILFDFLNESLAKNWLIFYIGCPVIERGY